MNPNTQAQPRPSMQLRWAAVLALALLLLAPAALAEESGCPETGDNPTNPIVSLTTPLGEICVELFADTAPGHVENFLWYLDHEAIDGSFFHRSVPGFIIQGGGFRAVAQEHQSIPAREGVVVENEPCELDLFTNDLPAVPICSTRGNERGTLALAKLGGDPDSGTTNWFINLADNRANLDNQNSGFTVFGHVLGESMSVVDAIAALEPASLTHLFWRDSEIQSAFTGNGESTLPLLATPALDAGDFGCFEAESLAVVLPYDPQQPTPVSGACGQRVDPEVYEYTPPGEGCDYGSVLAAAATVLFDSLEHVADSDGVDIYYEFSCAQTEELVAQLAAWRPDFNTRFDAQLVTIENAVRVPEPCCGPGATLAALTVVSALARRKRAFSQ
jgi:cyclophilin family peptidyl-prolyl cis-trans isomerase